MIEVVMKSRILATRALVFALVLVCLALSATAQKKKKGDDLQKPMAGPRATALRVTWLYVTPDTGSQKVDRVQIGREMVMAERSGAWMRVYANTDIEELQEDKDTPILDTDATPPPVSGWIQIRGIVVETTPNGDQVLMGAAANQEALASDPRGPVNAAQSARLLYQRLFEMFPNSPLAPEAQWRAADIKWQLEKADASTLRSSHEKAAYMREQMLYPHTRQADLAAFELIDNKLCGDWEGSVQCPQKESEIYEKYADEHPDSPRTAQALYLAVYRQAVLKDMYSANGDDKKSEAAKNHAHDLAARLKDHFATTDYAWRAGALVYKLDEDIPVYGIDQK
jgi:hypothetical protein